MKQISIWCSHPNMDESIVNREILDILKQHQKLNIYLLDELYPDYQINVSLEQERLLQSDHIILLFPVYWVSMPGMMSIWREKVFREGFAYTPPHSQEVSKLFGKDFSVVLTLGAPESAYQKDGFIKEEWSAYTTWIQAMAHFTGMNLCNIYSFFNASSKNTEDKKNRIISFTNTLIKDLGVIK